MIGVYYIKCLINKRIYIGSSENIKRRLDEHFRKLNQNKHYNAHLQNSFLKYGINNFRVGVICVCGVEELLKYEQFYIDHNKNLFNIVKKDVERPTMDSEVRRIISLRINQMYQSGELSRINSGSIKKGTKPWNTGQKYNSTDHLKVPKLKKGDRSKDKETKRENAPLVQVEDQNENFLGRWRSSKDLEEESKKEDFCLIPYMILRNPSGRNGYSPYELRTFNINKSSRTGLPYKGLYFKLLSWPH